MNKICLIVLSMLLQACASSSNALTQVSYYLLDASPVRTQETLVQANSELKPIMLGRVSLPDYLNQSKLVLKLDKQEVRLANYHNWAEPVTVAVTRILRRELNAAQSLYRVLDSCSECDKLSVDIEHFYPTSEGDVILSGVYSWRHKGRDEKPVYRDFIFTRELQVGGYREAVEQMNAVVKLLGNAIALEIAGNQVGLNE
ncbi:membrane integrity-associated transporter subunit PqiC [Arenicella sp. 4NH20-0111]|uniref:PqiC family protein n=1 Tax=Arenicella sp. 4NH20-0111 TaxID=3127648 RepID=UPI0031028945